jgi:hypothetical protein
MAEIRPLERADLPAVVAPLRAHMPDWGLGERILAGLILDHPWHDPELASQVAIDGDQIIGFTGTQVRRLVFDGKPIRGVCSTQGVMVPDKRAGAAGALMIGRVLSGPQEITWSDSTIDPVCAVFRAYGGEIDHARSCDFMLVLRPARWLGHAAAAFARRTISRLDMPVEAVPAHAAGRRVLPRAFPDPLPTVRGEDATPATIVEHLPALNKRLRVWVDHDEEQLTHLFGLVESVWGPVTCRLVRGGENPIGWYAYLPSRGGVSRVLHLAALERHADAVLGELVAHARGQGSAVLSGRAEPHLQKALAKRLAVLAYRRQPTLLAKDPVLAAAMATNLALLTRLEGEVFAV